MPLTDERLSEMIRMLPKCGIVADIGTDHGRLGAQLLLTGKCGKVWFSDISAPSLEKARGLIARRGLQERAEFFVGDGARALPGAPDAAVIAGMGGETIIQILTDSPWPRTSGCTLLLQPQTKVELLRRWLSENGYACRDERLVWDKGKLYVVLQMAAGEAFTPEEARLYAGFCLENDPLYGDYLDAQLRRLRRRLEGLHRSREDADCGTLPELIAALEKKKEALS